MNSEVTAMKDSGRRFLPAAGYDLFLPLYDPLVKLLGGEKARTILLEQAELQPGQRVLDVGCGTGTMVVLLKRLYPRVEVAGIDPDPKALARARSKADTVGLAIQLEQAFSDHLPFPDSSFDRVLSSFMFHHLESKDKGETLKEIRRVLKPGGSLHLLDFAGPSPGHHSLMRFFHSHERLQENSADRVLSLMKGAGLQDEAKITESKMFLFRTVYYRAFSPIV